MRYSPHFRENPRADLQGHSHGVFSPSAHQTWAATYAGFTSPDCAAPSVFLKPLTPCSALEPSVLRRPAPSCRPFFMPTTLLGFPPPEVFPPRGPLGLSTSLPLSTFPDRDLPRERCRSRSSPAIRRWPAVPPSGVWVPLGIRSSDQGRLTSWLEPILSWVFNSSGFSPQRPWRSHRSSSCPVLALTHAEQASENALSGLPLHRRGLRHRRQNHPQRGMTTPSVISTPLPCPQRASTFSARC